MYAKRCAWEIVETDTEWQATWNAADDGGTCGTCADRASMWNPYVQAPDTFKRSAGADARSTSCGLTTLIRGCAAAAAANLHRFAWRFAS